MVTIHFKDYNTSNNDSNEILKGLVNLVGDKVVVAKEAVRLWVDRDKIKTDAAMKRVDAIKTIADASMMRVEARLRKQPIKEAKYEDSIMMIDTSMMSPTNAAFYEEKKVAIRMKRGHSSSTE